LLSSNQGGAGGDAIIKEIHFLVCEKLRFSHTKK
jgi:hypothetical protein